MLWQPSLPDAYTKMAPADLARRLAAAGAGQDLGILGHHYQTDDIIQHATTPAIRSSCSQTAAKLARGRARPSTSSSAACTSCRDGDMLTPESGRGDPAGLVGGLLNGGDMAQYDDTVEAWEASMQQRP